MVMVMVIMDIAIITLTPMTMIMMNFTSYCYLTDHFSRTQWI